MGIQDDLEEKTGYRDPNLGMDDSDFASYASYISTDDPERFNEVLAGGHSREQGDPYSTTHQFVEEVVETVADMIATRQRRTEIRRRISLMIHGPKSEDDDETPARLVSEEKFKKVISRAYKLLAVRVHTSRDKAQLDAVGLYESIIANPDSTFAHKIKAQENLDKIYGLNTVNLVINTPEEMARQAMLALQEGGALIPSITSGQGDVM